MRVAVTQQMPQKDAVWTDTIQGVVLGSKQAKTGSWFAHAKDDQLWLDRLELQRDDGEIVTLNLDQYSVVEVLHDPNADAEDEGEDASDDAEASA